MATLWYVLRVRAPKLARIHLALNGFDYWQPIKEVERVVKGRLITVSVPLFGPYGLVAFDISENKWQQINQTVGVVRLLPRHLEEPVPLPEGFVDELRSREALGEFAVFPNLGPLPQFAVGDWVEVRTGPFGGRGGTLVEIQGGLMVLLINLLRRDVRAYIEPHCVEPVALSVTAQAEDQQHIPRSGHRYLHRRQRAA